MPTEAKLTIAEAAKLLHASQSAVRRWVACGHLPAYKTPGGHRRFTEEDVQTALKRWREKDDAAANQNQ